MPQLPTPEQMAAMAREYAMVHPIAVPTRPREDWVTLGREIALLNALLLPLEHAPNSAVSGLAVQALGAVGRMQSQVSALDGGLSEDIDVTPHVRSARDLLQQALLCNARLCHELYREREGKSLAEQLPYVTSLSHYTYSLLLTLAAI